MGSIGLDPLPADAAVAIAPSAAVSNQPRPRTPFHTPDPLRHKGLTPRPYLAGVRRSNRLFTRIPFFAQDPFWHKGFTPLTSPPGVDFGGLARSLKSAEDENPLPCAKSLLAQGLCPEDVRGWFETLKSADAENRLSCARSPLAQWFSPDAVSTWGGLRWPRSQSRIGW